MFIIIHVTCFYCYSRNCTTSQDVVDFIRQRLINLKEGKPISDQNKDKEQTLSLICEEVLYTIQTSTA